MPKSKYTAEKKLKPKVKLNWVQKLKLKVKAYFATQKKTVKKAGSKTTARTKSIEAQLRRAGLTEKEIARMRSKK